MRTLDLDYNTLSQDTEDSEVIQVISFEDYSLLSPKFQPRKLSLLRLSRTLFHAFAPNSLQDG